MKKLLLLLPLLCLVAATTARAQGPNNSGTYYRNADGKQGQALKSALCGIIRSHTKRSYKDLWTDFRTTDKRSDGKVWDMYSGTSNYTFGTDQAGNYQKEGDVYNREHSLPNSWFGGDKQSEMYTDLFHMYPTDGYVNNRRGNLPFGETSRPTYTSNGGFSKLGPSSVSGYSGTVFEPNDEYKGDFARTYFYMITCYEDQIATWDSDMLDGRKYPGFTQWALQLLMRWSEQDPVSEKEINRNSAVYGIQHNRNPYIDYPGLERLVWGDRQNVSFSYDDYEGRLRVDGIRTEPDATDDRTYNTKGQRVSPDRPVAPGLYVRQGRKYVVK